MSYFDYPIDTAMLIQKKRRIMKQQSLESSYSMKKRIAILGGSTTNEIADQLEMFLKHFDIDAEIYQTEYGKYWEDAVFGSEELSRFKPDIIYIHTNWRNIQQFPCVSDSPEDVNRKLEAEFSRLETMWRSLKTKFDCPIIQNNFERPDYRLFGNRDIWDRRGRSNYIFSLNRKLYEYAQNTKNFYINDIDYLSSNYGLEEWNDPTSWYMYKYCLNVRAIPYLAKSVSLIIKSLFGKNKKLLALDLDNTLWGGIIGDDGIEKIQIGPESPEGQVYQEFQKYCKLLKQIGVVLAVNSKNDESTAMAGLNHSYCVLRPDDFVAVKANWNPKDSNLRAIADELSLGTDSFVFVDDNPAERDIVTRNIVGIAVPPVDKPESYIRYLDGNGYFEQTVISSEDANKTEMYKAKARAEKEIDSFCNYEEYLDSLQMKAEVCCFHSGNQQRISQLTNKSNQFNLTTMRCTETDIERMAQDDHWITLSSRLVDRLSDNGIVSAVAGEIQEDALHIRLWLMSCRVLKRTLEDALMDTLISKAKEHNLKRVVGYYYPTPKNRKVQDFYGSMGFVMRSSDDNGNTVWETSVADYSKRNKHITVEEMHS